MTCEINNESNFDISEIEDLIQDLFTFSRKRFGFKKPPVLNLVSDESNTSPLGKTAHYDPNNMSITIYVDGRHPKDIMRSFSHELVHHKQNENGMFNNIDGESGDGYAQSNPHLRKMEKQAYLQGNMCFRDWEDGYKSSNPNILNERRIYKMSIKDWKDKELNTLLNEKWGFSMNLNNLNENKMPMKDEPEGEDLNKDGKKGHGKVPAFLEEEEVEENLDNLKGGLKAYMKNKAKKGEIKDSDEKSKLDEDETEDKKEKFKKGLKGELDDSADQKIDAKLKQKIIDSLTISQLKTALKKKENKDPKEAKLREAIRRIIKSKLKRK